MIRRKSRGLRMSSRPDISQRINELFRSRHWDQARRIIRKELSRRPLDHWLLSRLSTTYYEQHKYKRALQFATKALKLNPRCPLVLWDYAGALDMTGEKRKALAIFKRLVRKGPKRNASEQCGEGLERARSLVNDSRYSIGLIYGDLGNRREASRWLRQSLTHVSRGTPSLYSKAAIRHQIALVSK